MWKILLKRLQTACKVFHYLSPHTVIYSAFFSTFLPIVSFRVFHHFHLPHVSKSGFCSLDQFLRVRMEPKQRRVRTHRTHEDQTLQKPLLLLLLYYYYYCLGISNLPWHQAGKCTSEICLRK